jgi:putative membrane protein
MIADTPTTWLGTLVTLRGTALERIALRVAVAVLWAVAVTIVWQRWDLTRLSLTTTPFSLIGVALSIFLGFRNNASYDRYWEARKLWGRVVNASRTWARQVATLVDGDPLRRELVLRQIAWVHALRHHLRGERTIPELTGLLPNDEADRVQAARTPPSLLHHRTGERLREAWQQGSIDTLHLPVLEATLTELLGVQGGCERIRATPVPWPYTVLTHRIVATYCLTLPFGLEATVGTLTPAVVGLIAFAFYGLDAIGDEIEEPFGHDPNDLPLTSLSKGIEVDLRQALGLGSEPPMPRPVDGLLD